MLYFFILFVQCKKQHLRGMYLSIEWHLSLKRTGSKESFIWESGSTGAMLLTHYKELTHTSHVFVYHTTLITLCVHTFIGNTSQLKDLYCHYWYAQTFDSDCKLTFSGTGAKLCRKHEERPLTLVFTAPYCQSHLLTRPLMFVINTTLNLKRSQGTFLHTILQKWVITVYSNTNCYNLNHPLLKPQQFTAFHRRAKIQLNKFLCSK